jgi:hypothetical protein
MMFYFSTSSVYNPPSLWHTSVYVYNPPSLCYTYVYMYIILPLYATPTYKTLPMVHLPIKKNPHIHRHRHETARQRERLCDKRVKDIDMAIQLKYTRAERYAAQLERKQRQARCVHIYIYTYTHTHTLTHTSTHTHTHTHIYYIYIPKSYILYPNLYISISTRIPKTHPNTLPYTL